MKKLEKWLAPALYIALGVFCFFTAHGHDFTDIQNRLPELLRVFQRFIFLSKRNGTGTMEAILDGEGNIIRKGDAE